MAYLLTAVILAFVCVGKTSSHGTNKPVSQKVQLYFNGNRRYTAASKHNKTVVCDLDISNEKFQISDVNSLLCTHFLFRQAELKKDTLEIDLFPKNITKQLGIYKEVAALVKKNPELKLLLSVGGGGNWNTAAQSFSVIAKSRSRRQTFAKSVVGILDELQFHGVDIAWFFPGSLQQGGSRHDGENLIQLLKELRKELKPKYLLTMTAAGHPYYIRPLMNELESVSQLVDHLHLKSYDLAGPWEPRAYHHTSLRDDQDGRASLDKILQYYKDAADVPPDKLVFAIAFHGQAFQLESNEGTTFEFDKLEDSTDSSNKYGLDEPDENDSYRIGGSRAGFREICKNLTTQTGWTTYFDELCQVPFAKKELWWVSFDDVNSIQLKVDWGLEVGLRGFMATSIDNDDYDGKGCHGKDGRPVKYPLLKTINERIAVVTGVSTGNDSDNEEDSEGSILETKYIVIIIGVTILTLTICFCCVMMKLHKKDIFRKRINAEVKLMASPTSEETCSNQAKIITIVSEDLNKT